MSLIVRDKEAYHQQTTERMNKHFTLPNWSVKQKLALTCRILAAEGHDSGLAGQATARGEKPGTYYMLRFGLGFDEITSHMDTTLFHEDCAWLREWPGTPIGDEEGRIISEAIGDKRAILLAHHGQLTACATVEEAAILAMFIERAAKIQLMAMSAGTILPIDPVLAREAHDYRLKARAIGATFHYYSRRILRDDKSVLG